MSHMLGQDSRQSWIEAPCSQHDVCYLSSVTAGRQLVSSWSTGTQSALGFGLGIIIKTLRALLIYSIT